MDTQVNSEIKTMYHELTILSTVYIYYFFDIWEIYQVNHLILI